MIQEWGLLQLVEYPLYGFQLQIWHIVLKVGEHHVNGSYYYYTSKANEQIRAKRNVTYGQAS